MFNVLSEKTKKRIFGSVMAGVMATGIMGAAATPMKVMAAESHNLMSDSSLSDDLSKLSEIQKQEMGIKQVACGDVNTIILKTDGTVWGCGYNSNGQLGLGDTEYRSTPTKIPIDNVKQIVCGKNYTVFLKTDGTVWGCGNNYLGQLGLGDTEDRSTPTKIPIDNVKQVVCGSYYTIFIKTDGTIWSCGKNEYGQLGLGDTEDRSTPTKIPIDNVKQVVCGYHHTIILKTDGTVWGCGYNKYGELGLCDTANKTTPTKIPIDNVKQVVCGEWDTIFVKNDGTIWGCGENQYGQLGLGDTLNRNTPTKISIDNFKQVVCGSYHTIFIKTDGTVYSCGRNDDGQLGLGDTEDRSTPTKIPIDSVKQVICGSGYTVFQKTDGTVYSCGSNSYGELGLGDTNNKITLTNATTPYLFGTLNAVDTVYNLDKVKEYGPLATTFCGKDWQSKDYNWFNTGSANTFAGVIDHDELAKEFVMPNGSVLTVDNYGMVNYYENFNQKQPKTSSIDGKQIKDVFLSKLDGCNPEPFLNKKDGSIYRLNLSNMEEEMLSIKESDIVDKFIYHTSSNTPKYFLYKLKDGRIIYFDKNKMEKELTDNKKNVLKTDDIKEIIPNTFRTQDIFVMKDGTMRTDTTQIDLKGKTVKRVLSNRFVELSDGCIYTLAGTSIGETKVRADLIQKCVNDLCWLKNGKIMQVSSSTSISYINDINGKLVKNIIKVDENGTYVLMKDNTTKGYGTVSSLKNLKDKHIDFDEIQTFISNNTSSSNMRFIVMKNGDLYDFSGNRSDKMKLVGDAKIQVMENTDPDTLFNINEMAVAAVESAEKYKTKETVDYARRVVKGVTEDELRNSLNKRLDAIKVVEDSQSKDVDYARKAVEKVKITHRISDYIVADNAVEKVKDPTIKQELRKELNKIKAEIEKEVYDNMAEDLLNQIEEAVNNKDKDKFNELEKEVAKFPSNNEHKKELEKAIAEGRKVFGDPEVEAATKAVEEAEESVKGKDLVKAQQDIDSAKKLVNALKESKDKTTLTERLEKAEKTLRRKKAIEVAKEALEKASKDPTKENIKDAKDKINSIEDGDEEQSGQIKKELAKQIKEVEEKQAEAEKEKETVAKKEKEDKATDSVEVAEKSKDKTDLEKAKEAVNNLEDGETKTKLKERLDKVEKEIQDKEKEQSENKKLQAATKAVEKAEESVKGDDLAKAQQDIDSARKLVNALKEGKDKTDLTEKLDKVEQTLRRKKAIEIAKEAVNKAKENPTKENIKDAKDKVNNLDDDDEQSGEIKKELSKTIKEVEDNKDTADSEAKKKEAEQKAKDLVESAEKSKDRKDLEKAKEAVNNLEKGDPKTELEGKIKEIEAEVQKKEEEEKEAAAKREKENQARELVNKAERTLDQSDLDKAKESVQNLEEGEAKTELENKIQEIQKKIDNLKEAEKEKAKKVAEATQAVEKAEKTLDKEDYDKAKELVIALPNSQIRNDLFRRLTNIGRAITQKENQERRESIANIREAEKLIRIAEYKKTQESKDVAQKAIDKVIASEYKDNLQKRLDKIKIKDSSSKPEMTQEELITVCREAERKIRNAEYYKTKESKEEAQKALDKVPESTYKKRLQARLDKVQIKDSSSKTNMSQRELIQVCREAENAVKLMEYRNDEESLKVAEEALEKLPESTYKERLQERVEGEKIVQDLEKALKEDTLLEMEIDTARDHVKEMQYGGSKYRLLRRINMIQAELNKKDIASPLE